MNVRKRVQPSRGQLWAWKGSGLFVCGRCECVHAPKTPCFDSVKYALEEHGGVWHDFERGAGPYMDADTLYELTRPS